MVTPFSHSTASFFQFPRSANDARRASNGNRITLLLQATAYAPPEQPVRFIKEIRTIKPMKDSRKSFFYNPSWRIGVYIYAWCYIQCFKLLSYVFPKLKRILKEYEYGSSLSAGIMDLLSGSVFWVILVFICYKNTSWSAERIIAVVLLLPILTLIGWLCLIRYRDYEIEKEKYGKI